MQTCTNCERENNCSPCRRCKRPRCGVCLDRAGYCTTNDCHKAAEKTVSQGRKCPDCGRNTPVRGEEGVACPVCGYQRRLAKQRP